MAGRFIPKLEGRDSNQQGGGSSFVTREKWGSQNQSKGGRVNFVPQIKSTFFGEGNVDTQHHEPPSYELSAVGLKVRKKDVKIPMNHAEHAAFHLLRFRLFGDKRDHDAYMGQASLMNDQEAEQLEKIENDTSLQKVIISEIKLRRRTYGTGR